MTWPNVQTSPRGFSIWFEHAGVSVMFGPGCYGDHYDAPFYDEHNPAPKHLTSGKAEVAIRTCRPGESGRDEFLTQQWNPEAHGGVLAWATPEQVASAIAWALAWVPQSSGNAPTLAR